MNGPSVFRQTEQWALLIKPHGMPTAPLTPDEEGTLISWFSQQCPQIRTVQGKKMIEYGLIHRLDTATAGFVLVAKTQQSYDFFMEEQKAGRIIKTYRAYCRGRPSFQLEGSPHYKPEQKTPCTVESQFRHFGPGRREVRPVFPSDFRYSPDKTVYTTTIISAKKHDNTPYTEYICSLSLGFRHQIRTHLCAIGYPIAGDELYNLDYTKDPMHLYACGVSFIDPETRAEAAFSLPPPDKMIR